VAQACLSLSVHCWDFHLEQHFLKSMGLPVLWVRMSKHLLCGHPFLLTFHNNFAQKTIFVLEGFYVSSMHSVPFCELQD
jgi:hypothetical protein